MKIQDWWPIISAIILIILQAIVDAPRLIEIPLLVWFSILFMVIQFIKPQLELRKFLDAKPELVIKDYGLDHKTFEGGIKRLCLYIDVICINSRAEDVYPSISWFTKDEVFLSRNQGRWWIATADIKENIASLQTVNLGPNGMPRRLHIAYKDENGNFQIWYRKQDGMETFQNVSEEECLVKIKLNSSNGASVSEEFMIINHSHMVDFYSTDDID